MRRTVTGTSRTGPARPGGLGTGLEARAITKRFSGMPALSEVTVTVRPGTVLGLVGHNGAGKSTLLKVMSGAVRPDEGVLVADGRELILSQPADALAAGVSTVYQELSLLPNLTITENVFLGREMTRSRLTDRASMHDQAEALVRQFGLDVDVDRPLGSHGVAVRQLLEIAVATHRNCRYLLLDEPTTSLEGAQVDRLLERIRSLAIDHGLGILLVNHKLDELYAVADDVVALVDGHVRISGPASRVDRDDVVQAIAGQTLLPKAETPPRRPLAGPGATSSVGQAAGSEEVTLRVDRLRTTRLKDVSLTATSGRVVGLYGLVGSGRTEFLHALVGLDPVMDGVIEVDGQPYRPRGPREAADIGLAYLTEERKADGLVPQMDAHQNVVLPVLRRFTRGGLLSVRSSRRLAADLLARLSVRGDLSGPAVRLSGGNQQKVLLARILAQEPRVLLLDEPTKGVDIGVKLEIHRIVRSLARESGLTVLVVSSEEDEILELADEIVVFVAGRCDGITRPTASLSSADLRRAAWASA